MKRGIVEEISPRSVGRFLKEATLQPHLVRYWLNAKIDDPLKFKKQVKYICELHQEAKSLLEQGIHLISTDEMTGIQALERLFPNKKTQLKQVEKIEFEYERHGTLSLIANWDVAREKLLPLHWTDKNRTRFY